MLSARCGGGQVLTALVLVLGVWLALSSPAGAVVRDIYNISDLQTHFVNAGPGDELVLHPGTYYLGWSLYISGNKAGLIIRGSTGDPDDVIIHGGGMNNSSGVYEGIQTTVDNVQIRDLTVAEFFHHGLHFQPGADGTLVHNVVTRNIGEHHMKGAKYNRDGIIEFCRMEQTATRLNGLPNRPDNYLGGIDLLGATEWTIRDNVAEDIMAADFGYGDPGVFLWQAIIDCVTERNVIINCNKGIAYGNPSAGTIYHAEGGIIRNNFIVRGNDIGLELCYTKNVKVYNNTIYSADGNYFRSLHVLDNTTIPTVNLDLRYNIIRGRILDNTQAGGWTSTGDIVGSTATADWFVDPLNGDLHLTALATPAIDAAAVLADVPADIDGDSRPSGDYPDVGADEYLWPLPSLASSNPAADGTLPKTQNNVVLVTFDDDIALPVGQPALSIFGGGFEEGDAFTYSVQPDGITLKAVEQGPILTDQTWYHVTPTAAFQVEAFAFDLCTLVGDANNSGRVTTADYSEVKAHMSEYTDARYDLNGSGRITTADYSVVKANLGHRVPTKP